jgi:hypothetical protein
MATQPDIDNVQASWRSTLVRESMERFEVHVLAPARAQLDSVRAELELSLAAARTAPDADLRVAIIEADLEALTRTQEQAERYAATVKAQFQAQFEDRFAGSF